MNEKKEFQTLVKFLRIFHESKQSFSNHDALKFLFWNPILDTQLRKKRKKSRTNDRVQKIKGMRKRGINDEVCKVDKYDVPKEKICLFRSCYPECNKYGTWNNG